MLRGWKRQAPDWVKIIIKPLFDKGLQKALKILKHTKDLDNSPKNINRW